MANGEPASDDPLSRRARRKLEARRQILDAAEHLIRTRGYARTTMRDVARAAGLSYQTLYNYFPGKGEILRTLLAEPVAGLARRYEALLSAWTGSLPDALDTLNTLSFAVVADGDRILWRIAAVEFLQQAGTTDHGIRLIDGMAHDRLKRLLMQARTRGELSEAVRLPTLADVLLDLADYALLRYILNPEMPLAPALSRLGEEMRLVLSPHLATGDDRHKGD